jgi:hypothetical protein
MELSSKQPVRTTAAGIPRNQVAAAEADNAVPDFGRLLKSEKRKGHFWGWVLLAGLALAGTAGYWFRHPILRNIAGYLVVDEPSAATCVLVLPGVDRRYDRAAEMFRAGSVTSILLVERRAKRLEKMGFVPTFESVSQRELDQRGVPKKSITVIRGETRTDWERGRSLRTWLESQPTSRVVILCDRFGGRKMRYIMDKTLGAECASRVRVMCLPERSYDENNWWHNRSGAVQVFDAYLNLAHTWLCGEEKEEWREWDPEEFKQRLR